MNIDNERANFEAWVNESGLSATRHPSYPDEYQVPAIRFAWQGWLARAKSDKAVSVEALEDFIAKNTGHCGTLVLNDLRALIAKETGK